MLGDARRMAETLGDLDELFRVYANLTTVLDLAGRHEEAVTVAQEGIDAARSAGLEAVYGNVLRGNAADSLFLLGRWQEARAMSMTALEWLPAGVNFLNTMVALAAVEIELSAGETAGRLLGQTMLELEAVRDAQQAVPLHLAAASFALWRGDIADARRAADRGWGLVQETEDWVLAARMAAMVARVDAAAGTGGPGTTRSADPRRRPPASPGRGHGGREDRPPSWRRQRDRLSTTGRRVAGHGPCIPTADGRPGRRGGLGRDGGGLDGPWDPL